MKNLTLVIFVLAALGFGCKIPDAFKGANSGSGSNANTGSSNSGGTSTGTGSTAASGDPRADVMAAAKKFAGLPHFKATMDMKGEHDMHMDFDYVAPDSYHIVNSASMEIVIIGKKTYVKTGGTWRSMPMSMGATISSMRDAFTEEGLKNLADVKYDGEDTANGKAALVYSYSGKTPNDGKQYDSKIWVSKAEGLPIKIEVKYSGDTIKEMTTNYDTDTPVTIEAPVLK